MTYHCESDMPLRDNLHAIAADQIGRAIESMEDDGDLEGRVHDLRKRMKKLRGLLRLVRPGLGGTYRKENRELRDIARLFSGIRDSQVTADTLDRLAAQDGGGRLSPILDWAAERREAVLAEKDLPGRMAEAAGRLAAARQRVPGWPVKGNARDVLRGGLKIEYGRARKDWRDAGKTPEDTALLHDWRKRLKYHWYHCRLLRDARPAAMRPRIKALDDLSEALGDDHDLVVLSELLASDAGAGLPAAARQHAAGLAADQSRVLRRRAFALAPQVLGEKKGEMADRLTGYWLTAPIMPGFDEDRAGTG